MSRSNTRRIKIFFSYAHEDEELVDACRAQLSLFDRQKVIREWHDRQIPAGAEWKGFIDRNLFTSDIVLLFISPDFFRSDYCYDTEMAEALKRHHNGSARVIPVILRPCRWQSAPFAMLQVLPTDGMPVTKWANRDEACLNVADGIMAVVSGVSFKNRAPDHEVDDAETAVATEPTPSSLELRDVRCSSSVCQSNDVQLSELPVEISSIEGVGGGGWIARGQVRVDYTVEGHCLTCGRIFEVARRAIPMQFADLSCNECGERAYLEYRPTGFHKVDGAYEFGVEIRCSECTGSRTLTRVLRSLLRTVGIEVGPTGIKVKQTSG